MSDDIQDECYKQTTLSDNTFDIYRNKNLEDFYGYSQKIVQETEICISDS